MPKKSVATIDRPEFINIQSISAFVAKCQIKVLYIGQNRNHSFITKEVASNMAQTLPGCPIIGYYKKDAGDFRDHGDVITIEEHKISVDKKTKPYGFIAPDAKIWFQMFEDTDEFGNTEIREYLVTEGYLWTQFEGADLPLKDGGRPQSMELDEKSLEGYWSKDKKTDIDFFIINDAQFKGLCILGKDVEPCFEGASVEVDNIQTSYALDNEDFINSLSNMMKQLQFTLNKLEGGQKMPTENELEQGKIDESIEAKTEIQSEEFEKKEEEDKKDDKEDKKDYSLLETQYNELQAKFTELEESYKALSAFKASIEDKQKDEMIAKFYMLDDEDKKDVIENKSKYSLDEIESKLSVICVRKKVNFDLDKTEEVNETTEKEDPILYNLNGLNSEASTLPAWLKAVEEHSSNK